MGGLRVDDEQLLVMLANMEPITLSVQAYGPRPIDWVRPGHPVWAWVSWPHAPAERIAAWLSGATTRS